MYCVRERLGEGAYARVYGARHLDSDCHDDDEDMEKNKVLKVNIKQATCVTSVY